MNNISEQIKQTEQAMKTNAGLKAATVQYAKTRPVFEQYKATKYSRKFLAEIGRASCRERVSSPV